MLDKWALCLVEAWFNLRQVPARALLSLAGIVIGSAAIVVTLNVGAASREQAARLYRAMRPDLWVLQAGAAPLSQGTPQRLARRDALALPGVADAVLEVAWMELTQKRAPALGTGNGAALVRLDEALAGLLELRVALGRALTAFDEGTQHVLIGAELAAQLALAQGRPVQPGDSLRLDDGVHRVVGVLAPALSPQGLPFQIDQAAYVRRAAVPAAAAGGANAQEAALLRVRPGTDAGALQAALAPYWAARRYSPAPVITSPQRLLEVMGAHDELLGTVLRAAAGIAMLLGGLAVLNTLLASVRERRQEIGIRLAIGALPRDILLLFFLEAGLLSGLGGLCGTALGTAASVLVQQHAGLPVALTPPALLAGLAVSLATGLLAGTVPAWQAARLPPVRALKAV